MKIMPLMTRSNSSHCAPDALTDSFGWFIQFVLATLAFTLLIVKRFCEPPGRRRSWLIWFYDTSKQGLGAMAVHFANVYIASTFRGDPCSWYIINFLLDSTVGLLVIFAGVRGCQWLAVHRHWPSINFGEYGSPAQSQYWLVQSVVYVCIMALQKAVVALLTHLPVWAWLSRVLLAPITDARLEVALVVLVVPFFVNALMFWVVDNFLMRRRPRATSLSTGSVAVYAPTTLSSKVLPDDEHALLSTGDERERLIQRHLSTSSGDTEVV